MGRFKIDFIRGSYSPFALFWRLRTWFGARWLKLDDFRTIDEARAHYEKIKDLPEYLA